jgi:tetratricopeptide (TPR) repeat protein
VVKHANKAAALNVSELPEEREAVLKSSILENQLLRKLDTTVKIVSNVLSPLQKFLNSIFGKGIERIRKIERSYRFQTGLPDSSKKSQIKTKELLSEAEVTFEKGNLGKAESQYLTAIKIDPETADAYKGLGNVYIKMKEWNQARETFDHITKNWPQDDEAFASLATIEEEVGNMEAAKDHFLHALSINNEIASYHVGLSDLYLRLSDKEKALSSLQKAQALEPNNPKILDQLFNVSILVGNSQMAQEVLEKIKKVNPDHGKLGELEKKVKSL